jgi:bifunctional non-homologous end joining protein LigD
LVSDKLGDYKKKRDFGKTEEPAGEVAGSDGEPRFVIQEHSATRLHWDLRLEHEGVLASWALPNFLPGALKDNRLAIRTEDHPLEYLEFHGEIPKGEYGAGTMSVYDTGTFELLKWDERKIEVQLHGERMSGKYALFAIGKEAGDNAWMIHRMGAPLDPTAEEMPEQLVPMLSCSGALPPDDGRWAYEIKWDGIRVLVHSTPGRMKLFTRNHNDVTSRYPELSRLTRALHHHSVILDAEVVAFVDGKPSFEALQQRMNVGSDSRIKRFAKEAPVSLVIFDLLWLDGHSVMGESYQNRRELLASLDLNAERWQTPEYATENGAALLTATAEQGLEGVMAKRLDSRYEPGRRSQLWVKVKNSNRQEVVIGGWTAGQGKRAGTVGALLVGVHEDDGLRYAGRLGTGFDEAELARLTGLLGKLERKTSPFIAGAKLPKGAHFVEPELLAEAEFAEWTREGLMRAPRYKGLRDDKPAGEVTREMPSEIKITGPGPKKNTELAEVGGRELTLSNRTKVLYPETGFTKGDLIDYYLGIAPVLLPHLQGRALTLKRYPNGAQEKFFYEKNAPKHRPDWVKTVHVDKIEYVVVEELATLAWLGNLADLELHSPMAKAVEDPDRPTMIAFDLDPGPGTGIKECCAIALTLRGMFEGLNLKSTAKTSGSKGMQLYVPLNTKGVKTADAKGFAKAVAELMAAEHPGEIVSRQTKELRKGKVLIDWSQNSDFKTTVTVYSPRAKDAPTVSTPLTWDEVGDGAEGKELVFDTTDVLKRVDEHGDIFADVLSITQKLPNGI